MELPGPSDEAVEAELERVLASPEFVRSPRLQRFLRYILKESRAGRIEGLKEYTIGVEVFERGAAFDPRLDPIVRVEARRLRAKLSAYYTTDGSRDPIRIEVPTGGYEVVFRGSEAPLVPTPPGTPRPRGQAGRRLAWTALAVLALTAALGVGLWRATRPPLPTIQEPLSVAVLPLAPIGDDPLVAVFSDGLTEDIITQLARLRGLRVIARTSVNRFKETRVPIRVIAKDLGVETVLEGSVRRDRGLLRITAQLIDGRSERHLWAQSYDRTYANTLAIQGEVAREVTQALALRLSPEEQRRLLESSTTSPAAHEAYLRGVHHMSLRTPPEIQKGTDWLQKAVSLDPKYAAARSTLGETYFFLALEGAGEPSQLMEKARELAIAALAVDADLAEGHRALGLVHAFRDRDWAAAEKELRTAVELGPGMPPNHEALATALLLPLGRITEAVAEQQTAYAENPLSASSAAMLGRLLELAGNEAEGIRLLESAIDLEPRYARGYIQLGKLHLRHDRPADALRPLEKARELAPEATSGLGALAIAYARLGRPAEAEAIDRELDKRSAVGRAPALSRAEVVMALGRFDVAFTWLERAVDEYEPWVIYLAVDPVYEPLRADPRFAALPRRLGLKTERL